MSRMDNKSSSKASVAKFRSNYPNEDSFINKTVLIVDDDMRSVFVLSSILEQKGTKLVIGYNGIEGIQKLQENPDIDLVLMDIMMPEMDGYTAIKEIRKISRYSNLPIIALTAKAMKEDRQKCIDAGANEYLTKPIDVEKLVSLMKVWLYR
jgi:CheY-like chemotaxis protein